MLPPDIYCMLMKTQHCTTTEHYLETIPYIPYKTHVHLTVYYKEEDVVSMNTQ